jgi:dienelactone hydrolase
MNALFWKIAALCGLLLAAQPAAADALWPGRIEILPVKSTTLTVQEFLRGGNPGREVLLGGELRLPLNAPAKMPAVILVHGSGGIGAGPDFWARAFNEIGVAAFILDSFSGRGIVSTVEDQDQLGSISMMADAYRALGVLAAHKRIDPNRIAVMGFSKGAVASVFSAMERFHAGYGQGNRFAAHIGLYTPCNVAYEGDTKLTGAPVRLFHGISDDYVNIVPCREYIARLKTAGVDATLTEYPDSHHGYDSPTAPPLLEIAKAQSTRNCRLKEGSDGVILNAATGQPFSQKGDSCVAIGAHVGHNIPATDATRGAVLQFAKDVLLKP